MTRVIVLPGDCRDWLANLPDGSAHCAVTSPPYFGLRDYGVAGQIGLEATIAEHIAALVDVFRELRRVLRDDGTLWVNYGDAYAGSWGAQGHRQGQDAKVNRVPRSAYPEHKTRTGTIRDAGLKPKDLMGLPWRLAFALQGDGWWLRAENIWHKPNPLPESVRDRPTRAHEHVFMFSKSPRYYYDSIAVMEDAVSTDPPGARAKKGNRETGQFAPSGKNENSGDRRKAGFNARWRKADSLSPSHVPGAVTHTGLHRAGSDRTPAKRNLRSVWTIAPKPFKGAHFATFPPALIEPCIKAGCPAGGVVLDPFAGSGTTGLVARSLGRSAYLIEMNPEYVAMIEKRLAT